MTFTKPYNVSKKEWFGGDESRRCEGVKYCSIKCKNLSQIGKSPWNKGLNGVQSWTEENKEKLRHTWIQKREVSLNFKFSGSKWSNTRKYVLKRDNYICQKCGFSDPDIMCVDHIKPKSIFPELTYKMDNCMTMCPNCHAKKTIMDKKFIKEVTK